MMFGNCLSYVNLLAARIILPILVELAKYVIAGIILLGSDLGPVNTLHRSGFWQLNTTFFCRFEVAPIVILISWHLVQ